jgi:hypothetical protein
MHIPVCYILCLITLFGIEPPHEDHKCIAEAYQLLSSEMKKLKVIRNSSDLERVVCGLLQINLERPNHKEAFTNSGLLHIGCFRNYRFNALAQL